MDATIPKIMLFAGISGGILLLTFFCSLALWGGVPKAEEQRE
jgi:hypothetical protein